MGLSSKRTVLLFLALAGLVIVLLAGSLPRLDLQPGLPFPGSGSENSLGSDDVSKNPGVIPRTGIVPSLIKGGLAAGFWFAVGYLAVLLVKRAGVRRLVILAGLAVGILGLLRLLPSFQPPAPPAGGGEMLSEGAAPVFEYATSPLGNPPRWLIGLVIGGLGVMGGVLVVQLIRRRTGFPPGSRQRPDLVAQAAETALQDLRSGMDLQNVIVTCYARMSQALQEQQGIERGGAMTAREFEGSLARRGVPQEPVRRLTRLFETTRYGHASPLQQEEKEAVDCLTSIVNYCRRPLEVGDEG